MMSSRTSALASRPLGDSVVEATVVGLGCNNFGRRVDLAGTRAVIDAALEQGVTFLDTADIYGPRGRSETLMGEVLPRYENYVKLDPTVKDAWGIPVLNFHCKYGENEYNMAKDAVETIGEVCHNAGFEVLHRTDKMFPPGYSIHEQGTARMNDDPKKGVVNQWNQSHDVKNLFITDASVFPCAGWQNPTMTMCALAMRASEYLADQMKKGNV